MGILFEVYKDGEKYISLTEHSIKNIKFFNETDTELSPRINDITRDIEIMGLINADTIGERAKVATDGFGAPITNEEGEPEYELREIDSVRKLANWAIIPEYCECYLDITVKLTNARGDLVKQDSYKDVFAVEYTEGYDDDRGVGRFHMVLREREKRL